MKTNVRKSNFRNVVVEKKTLIIEVKERAIDEDTFFEKTGVPINEATADTVDKFISDSFASEGYTFINDHRSEKFSLSLDVSPEEISARSSGSVSYYG